jgi:transcriptional regulator GlxA family with amidase domain
LQTHDTGVFDDLHSWLGSNLASQELTVEALAEQVSMSPRHFARLYKEKTGHTPAKALELVRLEAARRMLEDSSQNLKQIARSCGFGDEDRMRTTFVRHLSITPRDYRHRFSSAASPPA